MPAQQRRANMKKLTPIFTCTLFAAALSAEAAVVITFAEDPNSLNSSLSGTDVFDFNKLKEGTNKKVDWTGVGTFDQLFIKSADAYGGAMDKSNPKGTQYSLQGAGTKVLSSTLSLKEASSYFGMWWSAGDSQNVLDFYLGDKLVSQFTTASLMEPLPEAYDGNPKDRTINASEPYAFINFFGDEFTSWDRIVLKNTGSSGFESDNYTSRVEAWDPLVDGALPGVPVAIVSGKETKQVTVESLEGTRWNIGKTSVGNVPGAPAPPWLLLIAFAAVTYARMSKSQNQIA